MSAPFTPAQEDRVREIVAEMIAQFSAGADKRMRELADAGYDDTRFRLECLKIATSTPLNGQDPRVIAELLFGYVKLGLNNLPGPTRKYPERVRSPGAAAPDQPQALPRDGGAA